MACWRTKIDFEKCHPAVNTICFTTVIAETIAFRNPIFLLRSFVCVFPYRIKRNGLKALATGVGGSQSQRKGNTPIRKYWF